MIGTLAPPAAAVPDLLRRPERLRPDGDEADRARTASLVKTVLARRSDFGITRVGSITRLDRVGLPVVQVARPLALSNAVAQGKGLTLADAAASALMESLETWSAERVPPARARTSSAAGLGPEARALYAGSLSRDAPADWADLALTWVEGWDLLAGGPRLVPLALVDTDYTLPSPHPRVFPRTTTGLGAGATFEQALVRAGLEVLERDAVARAHRTPHFFDRRRIDLASVRDGAATAVLRRIVGAGLGVGAWWVPAAHDLPVYWCHVMEGEGVPELAPLPAEGFACGLTHDRALAGALLEAAQARLAAISGAREDITRRSYPERYDRHHLAEWRRELDRNPNGLPVPAPTGENDGGSGVESVIGALAAGGGGGRACRGARGGRRAGRRGRAALRGRRRDPRPPAGGAAPRAGPAPLR